MKNRPFAALVFATLLLVSAAFAAEKETTWVGLGQCAKCSLSKTEECQNALVVKKDGKEELFLLVENEVSKKFHEHLCTGTAEIRVVGTLKEAAGKKEITASKIELVKK